MFKKIKNWYTKQSDTTKGMLILGLVLIVLIIIRWDAIVAGVLRGFNFYNNSTLPE
ncbi:MAG: hypothetical protein GX664_03850 [Bacteroidales bacterium]|nr:hypothetical protein [Bacteroidales bacterium]